MFCKNCGFVLNEENTFCSNCGAQVSKEHPLVLDNLLNGSQAQEKKYSTKGIVAFVVSLVGLIVAAIPCGLLALIFATLALKDVESNKYAGKGLVISGLVISIVDIVSGIVILSLL